MEAKSYRVLRQTQQKMLRELFAGVPVVNLSKRYGFSEKRIKVLAAEYMQGKIDIFDNPLKRRIEASIMTHKEEVQLLQDMRPGASQALEELLAAQATTGRRGEPLYVASSPQLAP